MDKTVYLITGSIAAGKSSLAYLVVKHFNLSMLPFVSTDNYYRKYFYSPTFLEGNYEKARKYTDMMIDEFISRGISFVWETVFSKEKKKKVIQNLKDAGYKIICFFVGVSFVEDTVKRSNNRAKEGEHFVEAGFILDRYNKSLMNMSWLIKNVDTVAVIDNTTSFRLLYFKNQTQKFYSDNLPDWFNKSLVE